MGKLTRRQWMRRSLGAVGAAAVGSTWPRSVWSRPIGSNDAVRVGIVGLQRRGSQHVNVFRNLPGVRVTALCDADRHFLSAEADKFRRRSEKVAAYVDVRKLLDDGNVDAVVLATPNHWHALMTVWACRAGKDVYVEKPVSHNIREGRKMVEAARKYKRIVQSGTQNRSDVGLQAAIAYLREGHLGKLLLARGFDYPRRQGIGKVDGPQPIPKTVDYNLFMGPAPLVPLRRKRLHYDWHFVWPTGNGDCGNRGVHTLDHIRWAIGEGGLAPRVMNVGGRFGFGDDAETPNTQVTLLDYKPVPILWELRTLPRGKGQAAMDSFRGMRASMILEYEGGCFAGGRGGGRILDKKGKRIRHFEGDGGRTHQANFIAAVRSRKRDELRADVLEGHLSSALCHMANISFLIGRRLPPQQIKEAAAGSAVVAEAFERMHAHLRANEIDLAKTPITLGPTLTMNTETERFVGECSNWANMLLSRVYRPPFVVPDNV